MALREKRCDQLQNMITFIPYDVHTYSFVFDNKQIVVRKLNDIWELMINDYRIMSQTNPHNNERVFAESDHSMGDDLSDTIEQLTEHIQHIVDAENNQRKGDL